MTKSDLLPNKESTFTRLINKKMEITDLKQMTKGKKFSISSDNAFLSVKSCKNNSGM